MNVLSLFDGMSCGHIALEKLGIKVDNYFASEIDKFAIRITKKNFPDTIHIGDVTEVKGKDLPQIDLLIGGSPCQGFSKAGKQLNFDDPRSKLFFEYVRILKETNPKYFLLENVKMKQEFQDIISEYLGVKPVEINAGLISAQNRKRLYWTNIPFEEITEFKDTVIADVLDLPIVNRRSNKILMTKNDFDVSIRKHKIDKLELVTFLRDHKNKTINEIKDYCGVPKTMAEHWFRTDASFSIPQPEHWDILKKCINIKDTRYDKAITEFETKVNTFDMAKRVYHIDGKHPTLTTLTGCGQRKTITDGTDMIYLTPIHCERLQTVPDNYTEGVSNTQRFKMLGNGWSVDVIKHIFSYMV